MQSTEQRLHNSSDEIGPWFTTLYVELKSLASAYLRHERSCPTFQTTALLHEAFLRLASQKMPGWQDRRGFFGAAATTMRRVLVDHARAKKAKKRSARHQEPLDDIVAVFEESVSDLGQLDEALDALRRIDPRKAQIVELRYFVGLSPEEVGNVLDLSSRTVVREWTVARAWLFGELSKSRKDAQA